MNSSMQYWWIGSGYFSIKQYSHPAYQATCLILAFHQGLVVFLLGWHPGLIQWHVNDVATCSTLSSPVCGGLMHVSSSSECLPWTDGGTTLQSWGCVWSQQYRPAVDCAPSEYGLDPCCSRPLHGWPIGYSNQLCGKAYVRGHDLVSSSRKAISLKGSHIAVNHNLYITGSGQD